MKWSEVFKILGSKIQERSIKVEEFHFKPPTTSLSSKLAFGNTLFLNVIQFGWLSWITSEHFNVKMWVQKLEI